MKRYTTGLWNRMWSESSFIPASGEAESISLDERVNDLEKRLKNLERRLERLSSI